jgi:hypothetical protein
MIVDESIRSALNGGDVKIATATADTSGPLALRIAGQMAAAQFNVTQDGPVESGLRRTFNAADAGVKVAGSQVLDPAATPPAPDAAADTPAIDNKGAVLSAPAGFA